MKNSHKKISIRILVVSLLISGVSSQGLVSYASSIEPKISISSAEKELYHKYVKIGVEAFGYSIIKDDIYNKENIENISHYMRKSKFEEKLYFNDVYEFIEYIYSHGMGRGIYHCYIAGIYYKIEVKSPIKPKPKWQWWDEFSSVVFWD